MKFEELFNEWEKDAKIDPNNLTIESLNIPSLHAKYYKIYIGEKSILNKLQTEYDTLRLAKREFFMHGPDEETRAKGWVIPAASGRILRQDVDMYLAVDTEVAALAIKIGMASEKLQLVKSIIQTIGLRSYQIKNAIEFLKFQSGS